MIECTVSDLCAATGATLVSGDGNRHLAGVAIDSRKVGEGGLFVAFSGERVDGNDFAPKAVCAGAAAVALTREPTPELLACAEDAGCAVIRVADGAAQAPVEDDAGEFMLRLAAWWRARHDWCVVGVTGSVGKTTTKDMLAAALATKYRVHATAGNYNNLIGVPITLLEAPEDAQVLVVEMGMNHPLEISRLAEVARPRVGVITNVGTSHIGLLGSRENIARAKGEIAAPLACAPESTVAPEPRLFLCADTDYTPFIVEHFAAPANVPVALVGPGEGSCVRACHVALDDEAHPSFDVTLEADLGAGRAGSTFRETLRLTGAQVVPDFLLAFAAALHLGVEPEACAGALEALESTHMRQEVVRAACGCRVIDDSYNASPDSTAAALDALSSMRVAQGGRRVAILGEIGELGAEQDRLHELVGAYAAAKPIDLLVIVGTDRADHMERAARLLGFSEDKIVRVADVEALIEVVAPVLEPNDLVLVKASRAAYLDRFVKAVRS